jgi:hypothetical protein
MEKILAYVLAVGFAGTTSLVFQGVKTTHQTEGMNLEMANDGAYRDGLYLGRLSREARQPMHPPVGRWSTAKDRDSFEKGYREGFGDKSAIE